MIFYWGQFDLYIDIVATLEDDSLLKDMLSRLPTLGFLKHHKSILMIISK